MIVGTEIICKCGAKFTPVSSTQTECTQCMIKPSRRPERTVPLGDMLDKIQEEEIVVVKEKVCVDCGQKYAPTSNVQRRCPECKKKHGKVKSPKQPPAPAAEKKMEIPLKAIFTAIDNGCDLVTLQYGDKVITVSSVK